MVFCDYEYAGALTGLTGNTIPVQANLFAW